MERMEVNMETTTKVEDVHAQCEILEMKIKWAADYWIENKCDFSEVAEDRLEDMKQMFRDIFTTGGYAVAGLLMSLIDADAVQKWADSDRVEECVEPYDPMFKKVARAAYLDGVRDYARFVNEQLGITIARVEDGESR